MTMMKEVVFAFTHDGEQYLQAAETAMGLERDLFEPSYSWEAFSQACGALESLAKQLRKQDARALQLALGRVKTVAKVK